MTQTTSPRSGSKTALTLGRWIYASRARSVRTLRIWHWCGTGQIVYRSRQTTRRSCRRSQTSISAETRDTTRGPHRTIPTARVSAWRAELSSRRSRSRIFRPRTILRARLVSSRGILWILWLRTRFSTRSRWRSKSCMTGTWGVRSSEGSPVKAFSLRCRYSVGRTTSTSFTASTSSRKTSLLRITLRLW